MRATELSDERQKIILSLVETNMNVAATARAMHYHRNSVNYHIKRIKALTGLDPTQFRGLVSLVADLEAADGQKGDEHHAED